ncbi:MAG: sigma 54-interacting transcriptional regulator [Candidatus Krumholzibacteriota bacterium]|nr:sigma 54-interacting transcriptional regulator [Candidatus Krumholzibacteriota bacterium]
MLVRIVLAVEQEALRSRLGEILSGLERVEIRQADSKRLWRQLNETDVDLVLVEREQLPRPPGEWIASVRELPERPEVVVLASNEDAQDRATLLAAGSMAVLNLDLADRRLREALQALITRRRGEGLRLMREEIPRLRSSLRDFVSDSPTMQQFMVIANRVVQSDSSLLILGETGVGKERLARAIHQESSRRSGPFLAVNCGAIPETLLESELFGHERGAFTGATRARRGYFELAHGGTLFLDEIADVPLHLQVKLLRVLEDRHVQRLGSEQAFPLDVRIMAATNRDLEAEARDGRFRSDLYYRLAVVTLLLPPLRERREDIPALVENYLQHFRSLLGQSVTGFHPSAMAALVAYDWPGNVRELINVMERTVLLATREELTLADLPRTITGRVMPAGVAGGGDLGEFLASLAPAWHARSLADVRREVNDACLRAYLAEQLQSTKGRVGEAAQRAGVNVRSLYDLMRRVGLRKEDFKPGATDGTDLPAEA